MPVKDTIKLSDGHGTAVETPRRDLLWMIQTPQVFDCALIREAYRNSWSPMGRWRSRMTPWYWRVWREKGPPGGGFLPEYQDHDAGGSTGSRGFLHSR
ncbi:MAG: 2-C-methyl-D-erythritol 4-phosphate cytidylyltransferase [Lachnospiraceae bacterium]